MRLRDDRGTSRYWRFIASVYLLDRMMNAIQGASPFYCAHPFMRMKERVFFLFSPRVPPGEGGLEPQFYRARAGTRSWETHSCLMHIYIHTQMMGKRRTLCVAFCSTRPHQIKRSGDVLPELGTIKNCIALQFMTLNCPW